MTEEKEDSVEDHGTLGPYLGPVVWYVLIVLFYGFLILGMTAGIVFFAKTLKDLLGIG